MKKLCYVLLAGLLLLGVNSPLQAQNTSVVFDDQAGDYIEVQSDLSWLYLTGMTYSMWVKSDWEGSNYLVDFTDDPATYNQPGGGTRVFIGQFFGGMIFSMYQNGDNESINVDLDFKANEWVHLAFVVDSVELSGGGATGYEFDYELRIYVNGILSASDIWTVSGANSLETFLSLDTVGPRVIGGRFNFQNGRYLGGSMDDFSIHAQALTQSEIGDIVCTGVTPNNNNTIVFYDFNEGSGFVAQDKTGNGFDGDLITPGYNPDAPGSLGAANPDADFSADNNDPSLWAQFTNESDDYDAAIWDWGDGTKDTALGNPWHMYPVEGTYNVCLDVVGACGGADQFCDDVDIECPIPEANFIMIPGGLSLTVEAEDDDVDSVYWDFGNGKNSSKFTKINSYSSPGIYTICLYTFSNCGTDTLCQEYNAIAPGFNEHLFSDISLNPNPAKESFTLELGSVVENFSISILDIQGRVVFEDSGLKGSRYEFVNPGLDAGNYLVKLNIGDQALFERIVLE